MFFLPFLLSCQLTLESFQEIPKSQGNEALNKYLENYESQIEAGNVKTPKTFLLSNRTIRGFEENRKPLFGNVIYKEKSLDGQQTFAFSEEHAYLHNYSYTFRE